jgi:hypothetical protein
MGTKIIAPQMFVDELNNPFGYNNCKVKLTTHLNLVPKSKTQHYLYVTLHA